MITPYFIGLLEGDGSIQVNQWKQRTLQYRIIIKLKETPHNYKLCQLIQQHTQLFNLHVRYGYVLLVQDHQSKLKQLIKVLDQYPFLSQKMQTDYAFFKYCLTSQPTLSEYKYLKQNKHLVPGFEPIQRSVQSFTQLSWIHWWLVGFIEAEGCFCVRTNGRISFSVGQKNEKILIEFIQEFFQMSNKIQFKANNMFVIEGSQRSMLGRVIQFFDTYEFLGEKKVAFERLKSVFLSPKL